ncbi:MAG: IS1634 family transposase, partial [Acidobacteria bacterium]|nr:IS1634 family transposase [Acidobacteriota bacterium]
LAGFFPTQSLRSVEARSASLHSAPRLRRRHRTLRADVCRVLVASFVSSPSTLNSARGLSQARCHRGWYDRSAMGDLLGEDFSLVQIDKLYRCMDKLLGHKEDLFFFLRQRWVDMFDAGFDVLLYDLTSTYFVCEPPEIGKRKFGYSRDKRSDCVQVVIALIVTPDGFPIAYEVMAGNTSDKTTLSGFLRKIETQYGKANRTWVMDRGIPTEETLAEMKNSTPPVSYLVGTPRGRLSALEEGFLDQPWEQARESVEVKLLRQEGELYVLARSKGRVEKERAMRRRRMKKLWRRLHELQTQELTRDALLLKLGAAKKEAGNFYRLVEVSLPKKEEPVTSATFTFSLRKDKFRETIRREGHYLLRSNLCSEKPATLWQQYIRLTEIEQAFRNLKDDLSLRPIFHQLETRIEAHIFIAFMAYCLQVTLKHRLRSLAPGLSPREVLDKFAGIQMVDVHLPTTDSRLLVLSRYTQPEKDHLILLARLNLDLPAQPTPKILVAQPPNQETMTPVCSADL